MDGELDMTFDLLRTEIVEERDELAVVMVMVVLAIVSVVGGHWTTRRRRFRRNERGGSNLWALGSSGLEPHSGRTPAAKIKRRAGTWKESNT